MKKTLVLLWVTLLIFTVLVTLPSCNKVEFMVNFVVDGEVYATVSTSGGETIKIPQNPTKDGYTFTGWYWDENVWNKPFTANSLLDAPLSSDMNVYAKWEENSAILDDNSINIISNQLSINGDRATLSVSNATEIFSFLNDIKVASNATYIIAEDIGCENVIKSKTVSLTIGDNTYYLLVTNGNSQKLYTITIRRRPIYTVTFKDNNGNILATKNIEEGALATPIQTEKVGYAFKNWNYDFSLPIYGSITIRGSWIPNTDTAYTVNYYLENLHETVNGYYTTPVLTLKLKGTTGTKATYEIRDFEHFTYYGCDSNQRYKEIQGDGSLVINLYYTREKYTVSTVGTDFGSTNNIRTSKYGETITLKADASPWGVFVGWYDENGFLSAEANYTFTIQSNVHALFVEDPKMGNFVYSVSKVDNTCRITGIKDKTVKEILVPDYVSSISEGAFSGCSSLERITLPFAGSDRAGEVPVFGYIFGSVNYNNAKIVHQSYCKTTGTIQSITNISYYVPQSLQYITITGDNIDKDAFSGCRGYTIIKGGNSSH